MMITLAILPKGCVVSGLIHKDVDWTRLNYA